MVHSSTSFSPFEIVYSFNPLTPLDLLPIATDFIVSKDGHNKAKLIQELHEKVRNRIEKRNDQVAKYYSKGRKALT